MRYMLLLLVCLFVLQAEELHPVEQESASSSKKSVKNKSSIEKQKPINEAEEMRLMYQVFTYSSDLKNAYKVAKKAVKKYPESLYWHQKMAEVSQWLDKQAEAIEHYNYIYSRTQDKTLEKKILNYALGTNQHVTAAPLSKQKVLDDPSVKNVKDMIFIYYKIAAPEVAAEVLEELSQRANADIFWLEEALHIYIDLSDEKSARRVIAEIKKHKSVDIRTAQLLSDYYSSKNNNEQAYKELLRADPKTLGKNATQYYQQVSDLGWYLQDFETAAKASKRLYTLDQARLIDYERTIYYFDKKEIQLIEKMALEAYKKFDKSYLYVSYLNTLFSEQKYEQLSKAFERLERSSKGRELSLNVYFWLMKGQMYSALKEQQKALYAFNQALLLEPGSTSIKTGLLWFYIDSKDDKNLKKMIFDIEEDTQVDSELWLPLAAGNHLLQRPDRTMVYLKMLIRSGRDDIDIKYMYAYIMEARGESSAFMKMMREVHDTLQAQKMKNPQLMKQKVFLEHYLKSAMYFIDVDDFEVLLKKSKKILNDRKHTEISILWALSHNAQDRARYLTRRLSEVEPWMQLINALNDDDRTKQLDILYKHFTILPIRDRVITAVRTGNISLAQTLAFEGQEENQYDYLLYQQRRDLVETNVNVIDFKEGYLRRSDLDQSYLDISTRYYLGRAWSLLADISFVKNKNKNLVNFTAIPQEDKSVDIGLRRRFMRGHVDVKVGMRSAAEDFYYFSTFVHYKFTSRLTLDVGYKNNAKSEETNYLLLGGKKDEVNTRVSFQYLPSSSVSFSMVYDKFYSQNNVYLGDGYKGRTEWYQQVRSGYPDIAWALFYEYGDYTEESGPKGVIDRLQTFPGIVLPETFYNVGANFFYGVMNKEYYTRVWRPYVEVSPYYNGLNNQLNFSFSAGYGGSLFDKDHLTFGVSYDQTVNGTNYSTQGLYMRYRMFF